MSSLQKKFKLPTFKVLIPAIICGICASDVAVWNVPFKNLVLLRLHCLLIYHHMGWHWFVFIFKTKTCTNFWIGTVISLVGMIMLVGFQFFIETDDTSFPVGGIIGHIILLFTY
jgi:biotin transporter BioY